MDMFDSNLHSGELNLKNARFQHWNAGRPDYAVENRPLWGILYLLRGTVTYRMDHDLTVQPGDVLLLPPGSCYSVSFPQGNAAAEDYLLNFSLPEGESLSRDTQPALLLHDSTHALAGTFRSVLDAYQTGRSPYLVRELFYRCMHLLSSADMAPVTLEQQALEKAARLLCDHPELPVAHVSQQAHMSRSLFQKRFKALYGMPPVEYRNRSRISTARQLLDTTDLPIKEIAARLGFYDVAYFHKSFRSATGLTPTAYRSNAHPLL